MNHPQNPVEPYQPRYGIGIDPDHQEDLLVPRDPEFGAGRVIESLSNTLRTVVQTNHILQADLSATSGALAETAARAREAETHAATWETVATTDPMTGLPNRLRIVKSLDQYAIDQPGQFAVGLVDLDGLKTINDTEGHAAGNELIITAATIIQQSVRGARTSSLSKDHRADGEIDEFGRLTARLGGDEFALIVDVKSQNQADLVGERIQSNLAVLGISASVGMSMHIPGETGIDTLNAADYLMYETKNAARRERQRVAIASLAPEVRTATEEIIEKLGQIGMTVTELHRLYGDSSR